MMADTYGDITPFSTILWVSLTNRKSLSIATSQASLLQLGGGTICPHLCVTAEIPYLVLLDEEKKTCDIFELTVVPFETRITKANELKMEKYTHFLTDINPNFRTTVRVTPFEIGSRGLITSENRNISYALE
jgi:hypothetical protein